ncbi:hypothetical protein RB195_016274 [Necator americanus]|uniref:SCP domain-containing protein n=1 Tax=Necator americanus TaxID=51031 RepID=A0ABR1E8S1_NECAM
MAIFISVVLCAFFFLPSEALYDLEPCYGERSMKEHKVRQTLFALVNTIESPNPKFINYDCNTENLASLSLKEPKYFEKNPKFNELKLVETRYEGKREDYPSRDVFLQDAVDRWSEELNKYNSFRRFGCNFSEDENKFITACLFKQ